MCSNDISTVTEGAFAKTPWTCIHSLLTSTTTPRLGCGGTMTRAGGGGAAKMSHAKALLRFRRRRRRHPPPLPTTTPPLPPPHPPRSPPPPAARRPAPTAPSPQVIRSALAAMPTTAYTNLWKPKGRYSRCRNPRVLTPPPPPPPPRPEGGVVATEDATESSPFPLDALPPATASPRGWRRRRPRRQHVVAMPARSPPPAAAASPRGRRRRRSRRRQVVVTLARSSPRAAVAAPKAQRRCRRSRRLVGVTRAESPHPIAATPGDRQRPPPRLLPCRLRIRWWRVPND